MYDEYKLRPEDLPVHNSVMNNQWAAADGDFNWLNFSVAKNNTQRNEQHRNYGASAWETLARPISQDPRDGDRVNLPVRLYYSELASVAPGPGADSPIELEAQQSQARSVLNIVWGGGMYGFNTQTLSENYYEVSVEALPGPEVSYPEPIILMARVAKRNMIAGADVTAAVVARDGSITTLILSDDGVLPDAVADDGLYAGYLPYNQGGMHNVTVVFTNDSGKAFFTQYANGEAVGPNGETLSPSPIPVGENFIQTAGLNVFVNNFAEDDHPNTEQNATVLEPVNKDAPGRIDEASDIDTFVLTAPQTGNFVFRVSGLTFNMRPHVHISASDGSLLYNHDVNIGSDSYFYHFLELKAGQVVYAQISHQNTNATEGGYYVSFGAPVANERLYSIYLPVVMR
jgi:hypothetical protein